MLSSLHSWRATKKPGHVFIFVFEWPKNGILRIPPYNHEITAASLLADPSAKLTVKQNGKGITVKGLPSKSCDPIASVIDLKY
jgi:alpha-L-fucosidase